LRARVTREPGNLGSNPTELPPDPAWLAREPPEGSKTRGRVPAEGVEVHACIQELPHDPPEVVRDRRGVIGTLAAVVTDFHERTAVLVKVVDGLS
jgi:hypothetical protein